MSLCEVFFLVGGLRRMFISIVTMGVATAMVKHARKKKLPWVVIDGSMRMALFFHIYSCLYR